MYKSKSLFKHLVVFQDLLSKWPFVFPVPDQKAERIVRLLVEEVVPVFGVLEALLSDRGTNLLSHLMQDVCRLMGIKKLNTTAYHPQCDGMVERFNSTFKTILRKHAVTFGTQRDQHLPGVLWAYRFTPHKSTREKLSYLLFGVDCRTPTEVTYLPPTSLHPTDVSEYQEELQLSMSVARKLAAESIQKAQKKYKCAYMIKSEEHLARSELANGCWFVIYGKSKVPTQAQQEALKARLYRVTLKNQRFVLSKCIFIKTLRSVSIK